MTTTGKRKVSGRSAAEGAARQALRESLFDGCRRYERERHLPRVIPVGPNEIADLSAQGRQAIVRKLARALRAERARGRAGHWTYDLNRHIALRQAFLAERLATRPG